MPLLWIPVTIAAAAVQVARNGLQRNLTPEAGHWGATLVRFLFGLPFSVLFALVAVLATPGGVHAHFSPAFWVTAMTGALAQVLATAALLVAMQRAGFAVGTALQQSSLPLSAFVGLFVFHDQLSTAAWVGVAITSAGLAVLTWPRHATGPKPLSGALFGLLSGLFFGLALNAFRHAAIGLEPHHPLFAAVACVSVVQAVQAAVLTLVLAARQPAALKAVFGRWRESLAAGFFGACASSGWVLALSLAPAASVRAVGVIEVPIAALAGRRFFGERLHLTQILAGCAVLAGVILTTLH